MISVQEFKRLRKNFEESKSEKDRIDGAVEEFKRKLKEDHGTSNREQLKEMLRKAKIKRDKLEEQFTPLKEKFEQAYSERIQDE